MSAAIVGIRSTINASSYARRIFIYLFLLILLAIRNNTFYKLM